MRHTLRWAAVVTGLLIATFSQAPLSIADVDPAVDESAVNHSGRTDKNGCHTNRKTGDYHCH